MRTYLKKLTTLLSGVFLAQLFSILLIPILSRLYSPNEFGEYALFVSITGILSLIATLKLNEAIMVSNSQKETDRIIGAIIYFNILLLVLMFLFALVLVVLINFGFVGLNFSNTFIFLLPLNIIFFSLFTTTGVIFTKNSQYQIVSLSNIWRSIGLNISQLLLNFFNFVNGLLLGSVIGNFLGARFTFRKVNWKFCTFKNFKYILKKYKNFPLYNLPQALFNNFSISLPQLMLIIPFGATNIGLFYMVLKLLNLPTTLISNVVTNLYYQEVSQLFNENKKVFKHYFKTVFYLSLIIVPIGFIIIINSDLIVTFLGEEWVKAESMILPVTLWTLSIFIYKPATKTIIILSLQRMFAFYTLFELIVRFLILFYGINYLTFTEVIMYFCYFNFLSNIFVLLLVGLIVFIKEK